MTEETATKPNKIDLSEADMCYLICQDWPTRVWHETEPKQIKFTPDPERQKLLDSFVWVDDDYFVHMDNHGVNIRVFVYREVVGGPLLGFLHGSSSEEGFYGRGYFGKRDLGPFLVTEKQVTKTDYSRADGGKFCS